MFQVQMAKLITLCKAITKPVWRSTSDGTECTDQWLFIPLLTWSDGAINLLWLREPNLFICFCSSFQSQDQPEGSGSDSYSFLMSTLTLETLSCLHVHGFCKCYCTVISSSITVESNLIQAVHLLKKRKSKSNNHKRYIHR